MTRSTFAALTAIALAFTPASAFAQAAQPFMAIDVNTPLPGGGVLDVAAAAGEFQTFLRAVEAAGYEETLRGEGPFTIFAPTDAAFADMDPDALERLMQPQARDELLALLAYHVVAERVTTASIEGRQMHMEAASGFGVTLDARDGLRVNDQLVVTPDLEAGNGVIHGVNAVLTPPVAVARR